MLAAGSRGLDETPFSDDGVRHEDRNCENQQDARQAASLRRALVAGADFLCAGPIWRPKRKAALSLVPSSCGR
jgi:hypothetical protein